VAQISCHQLRARRDTGHQFEEEIFVRHRLRQLPLWVKCAIAIGCEDGNQLSSWRTLHEASIRRSAWAQLMRALLVAQEGIHRGALSAARALKKAGWFVGCTSDDPRSLAAASRATDRWHYTPSPADDLDAFVDAVQAAVVEGGYEVLLPGGDAETLALSAGRDRISACVPYPSHDNVLRAFDKLDLVIGASRAGLTGPHTAIATDDEVQKVNGPVVVKSRLHWAPGSPQGGLRLPTMLVSTQREAAERVAEIRDAGGEPLLQEIVRGRIMHCHVLMERDGRMITCVKQLSEPLQLPPEGGTRMGSQTVPTEESVAQGCASFLTGSRVVRDFKHSVHAARCRPSSSGGLQRTAFFVVRADHCCRNQPPRSVGMHRDRPRLWRGATRSHGRPLPVLEGDIQRALIERRGGLVRDLAGTLLYSRGAVHGVWRIRDPMPSLRYWQYYLRRVPRMVQQLRKSEFRGEDHPTAGPERRTKERA
jgi:hypothetical protein